MSSVIDPIVHHQMKKTHFQFILLTAFWLIVGSVYVWGGCRQQESVNLSATSGGQYPYLMNAKEMAEKGPLEFFGDRNRMPLYPALLATVYVDDWDSFVSRAGWFAIATSVIVLVALGAISYRTLRPWAATVLTLIAAVCIFIYKASFVQAELLYYGLFFASWLVTCRLVDRPTVGYAMLAGALMGSTYLTKASALLLLMVYVATSVGAIVFDLLRKNQETKSSQCNEGKRQIVKPWQAITSIGLTIATFLLVVSPYILDNKERFGQYFYNVNSEFFMWCDNWPQAQRFAQQFPIDKQYPSSSESVPSLSTYMHTHSLSDIVQRLLYGTKELLKMATRSPAGKYIALTLVFLAIGMHARRNGPLMLWRENRRQIIYFACIFAAYFLVYAWFVPIGFGDRFILSLVMPILFASFWIVARRHYHNDWQPTINTTPPLQTALLSIMTIMLLAEGSYVVAQDRYILDKTFVSFYFNETRELHHKANLREARKGYTGVIEIDPTFAPAHVGLGVIALQEGKPNNAIKSFSEAVTIDPKSAEAFNGLGSAYVAIGRHNDAIQAFRSAIEISPDFAMAWFNLGGTHHSQGELNNAREARDHLENLDKKLASQLTELIEHSP